MQPDDTATTGTNNNDSTASSPNTYIDKTRRHPESLDQIRISGESVLSCVFVHQSERTVRTMGCVLMCLLGGDERITRRHRTQQYRDQTIKQAAQQQLKQL